MKIFNKKRVLRFLKKSQRKPNHAINIDGPHSISRLPRIPPRILQGQSINLWITRPRSNIKVPYHRSPPDRLPFPIRYHSQKNIPPWNINHQPSPLLPIPLSLRFHNLVSHVPSQTCSPCTDIYRSDLSLSLSSLSRVSQSIRQNGRADFQISLSLPSTDSNRCWRADNRAQE